MACTDMLRGRNRAVVDTPGASLTADMDEEVNMVMRRRLTELMPALGSSL